MHLRNLNSSCIKKLLYCSYCNYFQISKYFFNDFVTNKIFTIPAELILLADITANICNKNHQIKHSHFEININLHKFS